MITIIDGLFTLEPGNSSNEFWNVNPENVLWTRRAAGRQLFTMPPLLPNLVFQSKSM